MAFNLSQGAQGGLGGAASGALAGSAIFPGIGTGIGAGLGALTGLLAGGLTKKKSPWQQTPNKFSPQQQQALQQILSQGLGGLQNPTAGFAPIEQQAQRQFQTQTVPGLAERFTAMGGGQNSSAFQGALGSAGADLQSQLAALKAQYGLSNQSNALQQLSLGLTPQTEQLYMGAQPGVGSQFLQSGGNMAGSYFGAGGTLTDLFGKTPSVPTQGGFNINPQQSAALLKLLQGLR